jgi:hypothetical protein
MTSPKKIGEVPPREPTWASEHGAYARPLSWDNSQHHAVAVLRFEARPVPDTSAALHQLHEDLRHLLVERLKQSPQWASWSQAETRLRLALEVQSRLHAKGKRASEGFDGLLLRAAVSESELDEALALVRASDTSLAVMDKAVLAAREAAETALAALQKLAESAITQVIGQKGEEMNQHKATILDRIAATLGQDLGELFVLEQLFGRLTTDGIRALTVRAVIPALPASEQEIPGQVAGPVEAKV